MNTKKVIVVSYDPSWPLAFESICQEVKESLGSYAVAVHHVGSTAVPGLSAKPIIDLDVEIRDRSVFHVVRELLASIGYEYEGNLGIEDREVFRYDGKDHLQKHHLYVCPTDSRELYRHLTFRDYLRNHPEAVTEYSHIKEEAARLYPDSIDQYMQYKHGCISHLYQLCGL